MSNLPFGIDISSYQYSADGKRKPDFDKLNAAVSFCAIRAGISWGYVDKWARYSWDNVSVPKIAYHVQYPGEDANRQMDHLLRIIPVGEHTRYCLDLELAHGQTKARITQCTLTMLERLRRETGLYPIVYSRASWVNQYLSVDDLPVVDWWLANYLRARPAPYFTPEKEPPPILPRGVDRWLIHQTGEKGDGSAVGVVSHYVDCDRWNGSEAELRAYFGLEEQEPEPEEPPIVVEPLYRAVVATVPPNRLRVRRTAGGEFVRWLQSGEIISVWQEAGGWARIGVGEWVMKSWIRKLEEPTGTLDVPVWSQRDPRWKNDVMGRSGITLGQQGCLMTVTASALSFLLGRELTPKEYNRLATERGGYAPPNLMFWKFPDVLFPGEIARAEYQLFGGFGWEASASRILSEGRPVLAMVDFVPGGGLQQHWVMLVGERDGQFVCLDPWDGIVMPLKPRYQKVFKIVSHRRLS